MEHDESRSVLISIESITELIRELFHNHRVIATDSDIGELYDKLMGDILYEKREYLSFTFDFLAYFKLTESQVFDEVVYIYNQLYYAIDEVGLTFNYYYLQKVSYHLLSLNLLRLNYDPQAPARLSVL